MVTIFIPTYNSSKYIEHTINSVLNQSFPDIEIICIDDSSTDNTWNILNRYAKLDNRVRIFKKDNEGSVPFSWRYVIPLIKGEYTLYMSHDDILDRDAINKMVSAFDKFHVDCVIPTVRFFEKDLYNPETRYESINQKYASRVGHTLTGAEAFNLMLDYSIPGFALWRTSIIKNNGVPLSSFNSDEYAQRLWVRHCRNIFFSEALFGYRQADESIVRGRIKPCHVFSLDTNLRLYLDMNSEDIISPRRKSKLTYDYYSSMLYLVAWYRENLDRFNIKECSQIDDLICRSRKSMGILSIPLSIKKLIVFLSSLNGFLFGAIVRLYSLRYFR